MERAVAPGGRAVDPLPVHSWDLTPREAAALQLQLSRLVVAEDRLGEVTRVAGADVHMRVPHGCPPAAAAAGAARSHRPVHACAAVVVLAYPDLEPIESAEAVVESSFPYVPGLLSFREIPALLAALSRLAMPPHLLLCDGQGFAHPRRCGLASHLGLLTGIPTIGVAKSRLLGVHEDLPHAKGAVTPLRDHEEVVGAVVRTRAGVKPLYVSVGHLVDLRAAVQWTLRCTRRYRLPETSRLAHRAASRLAAAPDGPPLCR